ncbi:MAG: indole-3-glycerol phosphate synthase TrpC [Actinomycetota bacterium]
MTVLNEIIAGVREDLAERRVSLAQIHDMVASASPVRDALLVLSSEGISIIAEVKRSSPSKGALAEISDPAALAKIYQDAGASVVSVLTEKRRFGGSLDDLVAVRNAITIPVLRKDFMVDEYQFYEARAHGADMVLLIVAALSVSQLRDFAALTRELGMQSLVEVHTEDELVRALEISPQIVGVNSRNLKTLEVDQEVFASLIPQIPNHIICVAESGITTRSDVEFAQKSGANVILVGEALVRGSDPAATMRALLGQG